MEAREYCGIHEIWRSNWKSDRSIKHLKHYPLFLSTKENIVLFSKRKMNIEGVLTWRIEKC